MVDQPACYKPGATGGKKKIWTSGLQMQDMFQKGELYEESCIILKIEKNLFFNGITTAHRRVVMGKLA